MRPTGGQDSHIIHLFRHRFPVVLTHPIYGLDEVPFLGTVPFYLRKQVVPVGCIIYVSSRERQSKRQGEKELETKQEINLLVNRQFSAGKSLYVRRQSLPTYSLESASASLGKLHIAFVGCSEFARSHTFIAFPRPLLRAIVKASVHLNVF